MSDCTEPRCGHPQTSAGHPRNGWVRVSIARSPPAHWYCSLACAATALAGRAEAEISGVRTDVGACSTCVTRHDIGHLCRSCGHTPPRPDFTRLGRPGPEDPRQQRLDALGVTTAQVRAWARGQDIDVPVRGPLAPDVIDAYLDADQPNNTQEKSA
jgi:hypothetical protein